MQPSAQPTSQPSTQPSGKPTGQPSAQPSDQPTAQPSTKPSSQPSAQPTRRPTAQPSSHPSSCPTVQPSAEPSLQPTAKPTAQPICQPSTQPSAYPTSQPTAQPSCKPFAQPSARPSTQPSGQPTSAPSSQPSGRPTAQPTRQPSLSPTMQPTAQPSHQPSSQPSRQPFAQPSAQPTRQPFGQPTSQPTVQPSRRPSSQPSTQPSHAPSRPTMGPTMRPSRPTAMPTFVPSKAPTIEWIAPVERVTEMQEVSLVNNEVWSCGRGARNDSQSCTVMDGASGDIFAKYALPWNNIVAVVQNSVTDIVVASDLGSSSELALCRQEYSSLKCGVQELAGVTFVASSRIPITREVVLVGTYNAQPVVSFGVNTLSIVQSYAYTSAGVKSTFLRTYSIPNFLGTFVTGTCIIGAANYNHVLFGWVRSYTGAMVATYLAPVGSTFAGENDLLVTAMIVEVTEPDTFIAGGLQLSDGAGTNAYLVRVNALFRSVIYGIRYRWVAGNRRRRLRGTSPPISSVKGMALVDTTLYLLVQNVDTNNSTTTVLKVDTTSGAILHQAHLSVPGGVIVCSHIVRTIYAVAMGCMIHNPTRSIQSVVISASTDLQFTKLPVDVVLSTAIEFNAESVAFTAHPLKVTATTVFPRATRHSLDSTRDSYTQSYPSTIAPTSVPMIAPTLPPSAIPSSRPSSLPSSAPSGQPSSSPSVAPSVSPQPSSQPSTSGPTITYRPTKAPTETPTCRPSVIPTTRPSLRPTVTPTIQPSPQPTLPPTMQPSIDPSIRPSAAPSVKPTPSPTTAKTQKPSVAASTLPTVSPSAAPTSSENESSDALSALEIGCIVGGAMAVCAYAGYLYLRYGKKMVSKIKRFKFPRIVLKTPRCLRRRAWTHFIYVPSDTVEMDLESGQYYNHPSCRIPVLNMAEFEQQSSSRAPSRTRTRTRVSTVAVQPAPPLYPVVEAMDEPEQQLSSRAPSRTPSEIRLPTVPVQFAYPRSVLSGAPRDSVADVVDADCKVSEGSLSDSSMYSFPSAGSHNSLAAMLIGIKDESSHSSDYSVSSESDSSKNSVYIV
ncbi:hypothetical protein B7Y94_06095 [Candidatus Saccharibacteria bacterium 32-49-12]|nr:MAG: hypothetical protein B7Y94_06095 [Candidatus Saccharibacteria bacterium 32-49-12]